MTEPREPHWCEKHPDRVATLVLRSGSYACVSCRPPRSWSLPPEPPEDVRAVRDREGFVWTRANHDSAIWRRSTGAWSDSFARLIIQLGPLTEVVDSE